MTTKTSLDIWQKYQLMRNACKLRGFAKFNSVYVHEVEPEVSYWLRALKQSYHKI